MKDKKGKGNESAAMAAAKRKLDELRGEGERGNAGADFLRMEDGRNFVRFLPRPGVDTESGEPLFYIEAVGHFFNNTYIRCPTTKFGGAKSNLPAFDTKCPLCRKYNTERQKANDRYGRGTEEGKAAWKRIVDKYGPGRNYYSLAYSSRADEVDIKPFKFGPMILIPLLVEYHDNENNFFSIEEGMEMFIDKKRLSKTEAKAVEYSVYRGKKPEDITEIWDQVKDSLPDLEEVVGPMPDPDEVREMLASTEVRYDEDEPLLPRTKGKADVESGDDGYEEIETSGEEQVEEEAPKVKISALKNKLRQKAGV